MNRNAYAVMMIVTLAGSEWGWSAVFGDDYDFGFVFGWVIGVFLCALSMPDAGNKR